MRWIALMLVAVFLCEAAAGSTPTFRRRLTSRRPEEDISSDVEEAVEESLEGEDYLPLVVCSVTAPAECHEVAASVRRTLVAVRRSLPDRIKVPDDWRFVVVGEDGWKRLVHTYQAASAELKYRQAFTVTEIRTTYFRFWFYYKRDANLLRLHVIHEGLHITINANREDWVRKESDKLLQLLNKKEAE